MLPGDTVTDRLAFLNADMRSFYAANSVQEKLPQLIMDNIKSGQFPELHGSGIKAANTRACIAYVAGLQERAIALNPTR